MNGLSLCFSRGGEEGEGGAAHEHECAGNNAGLVGDFADARFRDYDA